MKRRRKRYSDQDKRQAIAMVESGRPVLEVAQELEMETSCLYDWLRAFRADKFPAPADRPPADETPSQELERLRQEVQVLQRENLVLKKAAVILGTESLRNSAK